MEENRILSISIIPENTEIILLKSNIIDISTSIINNRIFVKYKENEEIKICSCFIFLSSSDELQVNDYFLINNQIRIVSRVLNNEIEYIESYDDNIVHYCVIKNKCKKIIGSTKRFNNYLSITIENSFIENIIANYKTNKKLPIKCKLKLHYRRVTNKTILVYLQEESEYTYIDLFKNILKNMKPNVNCSYNTIISIWRKRMIKKKSDLKDVNRLHDKLEPMFKDYYESTLI